MSQSWQLFFYNTWMVFPGSHSFKYSSSPLESRKRVQHKVGNFVLDNLAQDKVSLAVSPQITFVQVPNLF